MELTIGVLALIYATYLSYQIKKIQRISTEQHQRVCAYLEEVCNIHIKEREYMQNFSHVCNFLESNMDKIQEAISSLRDRKSKKELAPANRKPRTEEQRKIASEKRKQWWEEKRKKEAEASLLGSNSKQQETVSS